MNKILFASLFVLMLLGCKHTKQVVQTDNMQDNSAKQLYKKMLEQNIDFTYLQAKAKMNFDDGNIKQSFAATFRFKKDEIIWVSLTGPLGIEGGRVFIEKDRIQIIDRLNGRYFDEDFSYLNQYAPFNIDFNMLQDILLGNVIQYDVSKQKVEQSKNTYLISDIFQGLKANYVVNDYYKYQSISLNQTEYNRKGSLTYNNYIYIDNQLFANERSIFFEDAKDKLNVNMEFTKVSKETSLDFPFSVPEKYKNK